MNVITLLIDTFCATGCEYCELEHREKNPIDFEYEELTDFFNLEKPKKVVVFAGDTFYNKENILKAYSYLCGLPYVERILSISEVAKLHRDLDIRVECIRMCRNVGKISEGHFSLDLYGRKSGYYAEDINLFVKESQLPHMYFDSVLTINDLMNPTLIEDFLAYMSYYRNNLSSAHQYRIKLDYNSVTTNTVKSYTKILDRVRELMEAIGTVRANVRDKGFVPSLSISSACSIRSNNNLIKYDGILSMCGKVRPEFDIPMVYSARNIDETTYKNFLDSKLKFIEQTKNAVCESCVAKDTCGRCIKYIDRVDGFDGDSDMCSYSRAIVEVIDEWNKRNLNKSCDNSNS